jgi:hypothetical protein
MLLTTTVSLPQSGFVQRPLSFTTSVGKPAAGLGVIVRDGDDLLKRIADTKCAQWRSWTLARLSVLIERVNDFGYAITRTSFPE